VRAGVPHFSRPSRFIRNLVTGKHLPRLVPFLSRSQNFEGRTAVGPIAINCYLDLLASSRTLVTSHRPAVVAALPRPGTVWLRRDTGCLGFRVLGWISDTRAGMQLTTEGGCRG
jgi:hypothetical protein